MTKPEFAKALKIAKDIDNQPDLTDTDIDIFSGFGLNGFKPVYVTLRQIARLIRYQALYWSGEWDSEALNEIGNLGKKRFIVIG